MKKLIVFLCMAVSTKLFAFDIPSYDSLSSVIEAINNRPYKTSVSEHDAFDLISRKRESVLALDTAIELKQVRIFGIPTFPVGGKNIIREVNLSWNGKWNSTEIQTRDGLISQMILVTLYLIIVLFGIIMGFVIIMLYSDQEKLRSASKVFLIRFGWTLLFCGIFALIDLFSYGDFSAVAQGAVYGGLTVSIRGFYVRKKKKPDTTVVAS